MKPQLASKMIWYLWIERIEKLKLQKFYWQSSKLTFRRFKGNWPSEDHCEAKVLIYTHKAGSLGINYSQTWGGHVSTFDWLKVSVSQGSSLTFFKALLKVNVV